MVSDTVIQPPRTMMEVFKSLPEGTRVQLIENNLVMSPAPLFRHQVIIDLIYPKLSIFVRRKKLGIAVTANTDVYLDRKNAYQPDILFISNERMHLIKEDGLYGAPDLVIEILSPSTAKYDQQKKKDVYERNGVQEYWIVDPKDNSTIGYSLQQGKYKVIFEGTGKIESQLLDWKHRFK